jgi:hypothetical protein
MNEKSNNYTDYNYGQDRTSDTLFSPVWSDDGGPRNLGETFQEGEIRSVYPELFTCDVQVFKSKTVIEGVPIMSTYYSSQRGQGQFAIPEPGAKCIIVKTDQDWAIIGFLPKVPEEGNVRVERDSDGQTKETRQYADKLGNTKIVKEDGQNSPPNYGSSKFREEAMKEGDVCAGKTIEGNKILLYTTGDIAVFAGHICRRIYSKSLETITDFCKNFTMTTPNYHQEIQTDDDGQVSEIKEYKMSNNDKSPTYTERKGTAVSGTGFIEKLLLDSKTKVLRFFHTLDLSGRHRAGGKDELNIQTWSSELSNKGRFTFRNFFQGKPRSDVMLDDNGRFMMDLRNTTGISTHKKILDAENGVFEESYGNAMRSEVKYKKFVYGAISEVNIGVRSVSVADDYHVSVSGDKTLSCNKKIKNMAAEGYEMGASPVKVTKNVIPGAPDPSDTPILPIDSSIANIQITTRGMGVESSSDDPLVLGGLTEIPSTPPQVSSPQLGQPNSINTPGSDTTPPAARQGDDVLITPMVVVIQTGQILDSLGQPCSIIPPAIDGFPVIPAALPASQGQHTLPANAVYGKVSGGSEKVFIG